MNYEVLILDDNPLQADYMKSLILADYPNASVFCFEDEQKFMNFYENQKQPSILIIDIRLKNGICGINIVKEIQTNNTKSQIIFVSSDLNAACDVYEVDHCYFVYKPQTEKRLPEAVHKAMIKMKKPENPLMVHEKTSLIALNKGEILYLERIRRMTIVYLIDRQIKIREDLSELQEQLSDNFCQCHRFYIVNFDHVVEYQTNHFTMKNKEEIPISRSNSQSTRQKFNAYLSINSRDFS